VISSKITSMLKETIGLDEAAIGSAAIRHAIARRMKQSGMADEGDYLALLQESQLELTALIEEVVVPETWFFRQREAFRLMQSYLCGPWKQIHSSLAPRLLSVPSSSGEEAYSMAISLLEAGFSPEDFHIDAIDVSNRILQKAKRAEYGKGSFRGAHLESREHHFDELEGKYILKAPVKHAVHFHCCNILDDDRMKSLGCYDVIFCRNLLIYFDTDTRRRVVELLSGMLRDDGLLFVGHAETGMLWKDLFTAVPHPMAFAYRKNSSSEIAHYAASAKVQKARARKRKPVAVLRQRQEEKKPARILPSRLPDRTPAAKAPSVENKQMPDLQSASRLADQGHLEEARLQCEAYLKEQGGSAQAWFLLGVISDTQGHKDQAVTNFRKALYLDPEHYDALLHLSLLLDEQGDKKAAQNLRHRMQRMSNAPKAEAV